MGLVKSVTHIFEPNPLACGQAVVAMLSGVSADDVIGLLENSREITFKELKNALMHYGITLSSERLIANAKADLPSVAVLSLETPRCWHWSLYFNGVFYDPEHGILDDFPECKRKYFWKIG